MGKDACNTVIALADKAYTPQMETVIDKDGDVWLRRDDEWYCIGHKEFPCETCKHNQQISSICDDCTQSDDNPSNYEPQTERSRQ